MAFVKNDFRFELTPAGYKVLIEKGFLQDLYYELYDDDFIYTVNVSPKGVIPEISGEQTKAPNDYINTRYKLKNGE